MAVVTRYFSASSAGAGDGTSWADRAALINAGAWSTVITGFSFAGSDSLLCLVEQNQTYNPTAALSVSPTQDNPILFHACDNTGEPIDPPDPSWKSPMVPWDDSSLPHVSVSTNFSPFGGSTHIVIRLFKITGNGNTTQPVVNTNNWLLDWCSVTLTSSLSSVTSVCNAQRLHNCVVRATGTQYGSLAVGQNMRNTRLIGNASASAGARHAISTSASQPDYFGVTIVDNVGNAMQFNSSSISFLAHIDHCLFDNNGTHIVLPNVASANHFSRIMHCYFANASAYAINAQAANATGPFTSNCRGRDSASGFSNGFGNFPLTLSNELDVGSDTEYVNKAGGDYRMAYGSLAWGRDFGYADEEAPSAGGTKAFAFLG